VEAAPRLHRHMPAGQHPRLEVLELAEQVRIRRQPQRRRFEQPREALHDLRLRTRGHHEPADRMARRFFPKSLDRGIAEPGCVAQHPALRVSVETVGDLAALLGPSQTTPPPSLDEVSPLARPGEDDEGRIVAIPAPVDPDAERWPDCLGGKFGHKTALDRLRAEQAARAVHELGFVFDPKRPFRDQLTLDRESARRDVGRLRARSSSAPDTVLTGLAHLVEPPKVVEPVRGADQGE